MTLVLVIVLSLPDPARAENFVPLDITWSQPLSSPLVAPPAADDRAVYLSLRAGRIAAVSLDDGRRLWETEAPVVHGLAVGERLLFAAMPAELVAIHAGNGTVAWRVEMREIVTAPTWRAGWVVAGLRSGEALAMRAVDGAVIWRAPLGSPLHRPITIDGNRAYAPLADGTIVALDLLTGAVLWRNRLPGAPGPITSANDRLYVGCTDNFLYSLDAADGERRWRWRTGADVVGGAAVDAERVYFLSLDSVLRALDAASGVLRWIYPMDARPLGTPVLDGDLLVVSGMGRAMRVVRAENGTLAGTWTAPRELAQPPLILQPSAAVRVRAVIVTGSDAGEWRLYGMGEAIEPPPATLKETPGRPLSPGGPPPPPAARTPGG